MAEYILRHKGVKGFDSIGSFEVELVPLVRQSVNRSYPNLSECCKEQLRQTKRCGKCQAEVQGVTTAYKLAKIGKEKFVLPTAKLQQVKEAFNAPIIEITGFVDAVNELYFTDKLFQVSCDKKFAKHFNEYATALTKSGKVAVGTANINSTPYPVMMKSYEGRIVLRPLVHSELIRSFVEVPAASSINDKKTELMAQVIRATKTAEMSKENELFVNNRAAQEEALIEAVATGKLQNIEVELPQVEDKSDEAELKALQEAIGELATAVVAE